MPNKWKKKCLGPDEVSCIWVTNQVFLEDEGNEKFTKSTYSIILNKDGGLKSQLIFPFVIITASKYK